MLTSEIIKANKGLESLNDEQVAAICKLSENDENAVIGQRIGEIYRQMDTTIKNATGVERNGDEKTYFYLERAAKILAATKDDLARELDTVKKQVANGGGVKTDAELAAKYEQSQKEFANVQKMYNDLKTKFDESEQKHAAELFGFRVESELNAATNGLKFKKELPKAVTDVLLKQVIDKTKALNPEFIDNGIGGKQLVFKDADGAIMRNQERHLEPYTAAELITRELKAMDVLDNGRKQTGAGTGNPTPSGNNGGGVVVSVAGAKTRTEAYDIIASGLMQQGLTQGSKAFDDAMSQAWKDNNVASLPER